VEAFQPPLQVVKKALRRSFPPAGGKYNSIVFPAALHGKIFLSDGKNPRPSGIPGYGYRF